MATIIIIFILSGVILLLVWLNWNNQKNINISRENILKLQHLLEEERSKGSKASLQDKYKKLETKVIELNASAQLIGSAENIEDQIIQLEDFFDSHFKTKPPYVSKFCKRLKRMVLADERIAQLHGQVMRPLQEMLYTQEVTDNPEVQRIVLARMLDALWIAFDAVETLADGDNIRPEQQLSIDFLTGKSTRSEIMNDAKIVTTDPEQTPKWLRVIRRAVLPLRLDEQHPVLYSGYKLPPMNEDKDDVIEVTPDVEVSNSETTINHEIVDSETTPILSKDVDSKEIINVND